MALEIRDLVHTLDGRPLLAIDRLGFKRGECVLLTGPNGAGKSTLLRIVAGLLSPTAGTFVLAGQELSFRAARQELLKQTVYLHQSPYLFDASVVDNIRYGLDRQGVTGKQATQKIEEVLDWADLEHLATRSARALSGGESQRVAIARARVVEPNFLLLDEPTAGLDVDSRARTVALISELAADTTGVVLASHEPAESLPASDKMYQLEHGRLRRTDG